MLQTTILLIGLSAAALAAADPSTPPPPVKLAVVAVRSGTQAAIVLDVRLPRGRRLDPKIPFRYRIYEAGGCIIKFVPETRRGTLAEPKLPVRILFDAEPGLCDAKLWVGFSHCLKKAEDRCESVTANYFIGMKASPEVKNLDVPVTVKVGK